MQTSVIRAERLTKRYNDLAAVDGIDFKIRQGECFGFLGPNGAGKTSTMKMISCVSPVTLRRAKRTRHGRPAAPARRQARARRRIPSGQPRPRPERSPKPADVRALLRPQPGGLNGAGAGRAGIVPTPRKGVRYARSAIRRHEAAPSHSPRADERAAHPSSGRTDYRA